MINRKEIQHKDGPNESTLVSRRRGRPRIHGDIGAHELAKEIGIALPASQVTPAERAKREILKAELEAAIARPLIEPARKDETTTQEGERRW